MAKSNLPIEVHDHFRKANVLHGYVEKELGEAAKHALETGEELLAAKKTIPHGRWEVECDRLFDGSASTARFYMQFAKDMGAIPKRQSSAILMLEGTLVGAAKAARDAARPKATSKPSRSTASGHDSSAPESPSTPPKQNSPRKSSTSGNGRGGGSRAAEETATREPGDEQSDADVARAQIKIWADTVGRWLSKSPSIDDLRRKYPGPAGDRVVKAATGLFEALKAWQKGVK